MLLQADRTAVPIVSDLASLFCKAPEVVAYRIGKRFDPSLLLQPSECPDICCDVIPPPPTAAHAAKSDEFGCSRYGLGHSIILPVLRTQAFV